MIEELKDKLNQLIASQTKIEKEIRKTKAILEENERRQQVKIYNPKIEENIYCASDYAGFSAGEYSFYYGYEEEAIHPLFANEDDDDEKTTWAFTVRKNDVEIYRRAIYADHVQFDCAKGLLAGIGYWIEEKTKQKVKNDI
jgi:hypothetical protein